VPTAALLFLGALVISGITLLDGIQLNDEGLMLEAARRIAGGQVPYSDFWWFYPPGQPYLLGGLWELFGPSLLPWRILRVLCDASVAVLAWSLARRGGASPRLALAVWLASALAMAYPSGPHPFPPTLALCLGALLLFERRPELAGLLAGVAAAWRIEFAAYLGLGVLVAYALRPRQPGERRRDRARAPLRFTACALAAALVLYVPVVAAAGLGDSFDLLIRYPVEDFSEYQSLPFPLDYDGPLNTSSPGGFLSDSAENLLVFYLPLALVIGLAGSLAALALRFDRSRWTQVAAAVFAIGMAHYLVTRADVFHTAPLAVMVAVLASWAVGEERGRLLAPRAPAGDAAPRARALRVAASAGVALATFALVYATVEGLDRRWLELRADRAELRLPVADGVRVREDARRSLEGVVSDVRAKTIPNEPIYVATRRSDLVTSGAPLIYTLSERPNATRYDIAAPGVVTTAEVQREIVRDLTRARVQVVVRWDDPASAAPEPNKAGESSGVTLLDDYLERAFRPQARFGPWVVLQRR
jgi:hypothetical protein